MNILAYNPDEDVLRAFEAGIAEAFTVRTYTEEKAFFGDATKLPDILAFVVPSDLFAFQFGRPVKDVPRKDALVAFWPDTYGRMTVWCPLLRSSSRILTKRLARFRFCKTTSSRC